MFLDLGGGVVVWFKSIEKIKKISNNLKKKNVIQIEIKYNMV